MSERILVIESMPSLRLSVARMAGTDTPQGVEDFSAALEMMRESAFDYILIDTSVRGYSLEALIEVLHHNAGDPGVVFVDTDAASSEAGVRSACLSASVNMLAYLEKPVTQAGVENALKAPVYVDVDGKGVRSLRLGEAEFLEGLVDGGLSTVFQPRFRRDGSVVAVECFARWTFGGAGRRQGLLGAGAIVRTARRCGYLNILAHRMMELAVQQKKRWQDSHIDIPLSVNVMGETVRQPDFAGWISELCAHWAVDPKGIQIDITQAELASEPKRIMKSLEALRSEGFRLALDDFGAGFGAITLLDHIPFQDMIIDGRFLRRAHGHKSAEIVLQSAVELSGKLGMEVTAEGIENAEDLTFAKKMGVANLQGYHLAKPVTAFAHLDWLEQHTPQTL